ncbi:hypothetical protein ACVCAH_34980 [Micromonospora sp. LZ34]
MFLRAGGAVILGAAVPAALARAAAADGPSDTVRVDLGQVLGEPTYAATGFLHGLSQDGIQPSDALLRPLKPQLFRGAGSALPGGGWSAGGYQGYAPRWAMTRDIFQRVASGPLNAEYCIVLSDLWGAEGVSLKPTDPYPGDGGDWSNWEAFLIQVVNDVKGAGMRPNQVQYEIWNEPDFGNVYFPRPKAQYEEMWRRGVRKIRALDPKARIVGPTFTRLTVTDESWRMDQWLDMVVASGTAPDILSWHDLIPGRDPVNQAALARTLLAERGLSGMPLQINEYPSSGGLDPGYNTWYVARLERARVEYAVLAIYGSCCTFPQLDGLLTQEGDELFRNGRWWAYQRYAAITGNLVSTRPGSAVDAVAGMDHARGQARIVLGNERGDGRDLGTVRLTLDGIAGAHRSLVKNGRIRVRVERIPDRAKLTEPEVVREQQLSPDRNTLDVDIPWHDASSAYVVTLGEQDSELPPYVIVDATPAAPVLLPGEPTPVVFRLRNYTDDPLTLRPVLSVPDGYTAAAPAEVTVPANGDAQLTVTLTRTTTDLTATESRLIVGDQSLTVPLQPSENWVRIAAMAASSTHAPSSPANLNDGDTDPERWGGGGAGGWNDATDGAFPDWVTATWSHPVRISRVRVHTLDSRAYPAAQWGVRDFDVVARVDGVGRTLDQVRGNVAGVIESRFDTVAADLLEIRVLASNSNDYSRLIEIEAFTA